MQRKLFFSFIGLITIGFGSQLPVLAETKVSQSIDAGVQQKQETSPEAKFEEYGEVPNGLYIQHYGLTFESEPTDFEFDANNIRQDNQSADFKVQGAKYKLEGSWDQIPHLISNTAKTLYTDDGHGNLTLPDPLQNAIQNGNATVTNFVTNYSSFVAGANPVPLKTQTNTGKLGFGFALTDALKLNLGVSEQMKKGYQSKGVAGLTGSGDFVQFAMPIDYKTYNTNLGLGFSGKQAQWGLNYNFSSFKNGFDSVTLDNPVIFTPSTTRSSLFRTTLPPDNYAHNVNFDGGLNLPAHSRATAKVSFNYMRQNDNLEAYTANPALAQSNPSTLPNNSADAKSLNWVQDYAVKSRPIKAIDVGLRFHSDQLHNKTPEIDFPGRSQYDNTFANTAISNEPFSYLKNSLSANAGWQLSDPARVGANYGSEWVNRDDRAARKSREDSLKLSADYRMSNSAWIRASYLNARRRMKDYDTTDTSGNAPNLRMFDISDRDRNQGNVLVQLNPGRWDLSFNGGLGFDKYKPGLGDLTAGNTNYADSLMGLTDTRFAKAGIDIGYEVSERMEINAYYEYEQDKTNQNGDNKSSAQTSPGNGSFTQRQDTRYHTGGLGVNIRAIKKLLDVKLGYDITSSKANYDFTSIDAFNATSGIAAFGQKLSPPDTRVTKQDYSIKGKVHATESLAFSLGFLYEKYDVFDWATSNLPLVAPASSNGRFIYLGDLTQNYKAYVTTAGVEYKF